MDRGGLAGPGVGVDAVSEFPEPDWPRFLDELTALCRRHHVIIEGGIPLVMADDRLPDGSIAHDADMKAWYCLGADGSLRREFRTLGTEAKAFLALLAE